MTDKSSYVTQPYLTPLEEFISYLQHCGKLEIGGPSRACRNPHFREPFRSERY